MQQNMYITEHLRVAALNEEDENGAKAMSFVADEIEIRDKMLFALFDFISERGMLPEYLGTLDYEDREEFEERFGLDESSDTPSYAQFEFDLFEDDFFGVDEDE